MSAMRGMAAAVAKCRAAAAAAARKRVSRGRSLSGDARAESKKAGELDEVDSLKKEHLDPKPSNPKGGELGEVNRVKKEHFYAKASNPKGGQEELSNAKVSNDTEYLTVSKFKWTLVENGLSDVKNSLEFQSKVNGWSLGIALTVAASLPLCLYKVNMLEKKQRESEAKWEAKYKKLKRVLQAGVMDMMEEEDSQDEGTEEMTKNWLESLLSYMGIRK